MKIEVKELMSDNEMLSHIFLGCIPIDKLLKIKEEYVGDRDWQKESVKIPVEMKIGGVNVNPKEFFESWASQMEGFILDEAKKLVADKLGSAKMVEMANKLHDYGQVLESWESEINWDVENPFVTN